MKYLKLIRIQNLAMIAFMQILFRYTFMKTGTYTELTPTYNFLALSHLQFFLLVLATVCIAAAGYVINDILDQETDAIAKKRIVGVSISESAAYNLYVALNVIGVGIGFYLSNAINKPSFSALFIITAALLYVYSTSLKQIAVVGNIIVALIASFSIIIIGIFDLIPSTHEGNMYWQGNKEQMKQVFSILTDYAIFAFIINFLRELVKDVEDTDADYASGIATLPVLIGKNRTVKIIFGLSFIPIITLIYYLSKNLYLYDYVVYYAIIFIIAPLLFFTIKSWNAKTQKEFHNLSTLLKIILFLGILSIWVITYATTHHA
ncbi:geranylgeranylglycerol-phosphate geranylgeranyltransferase [Flavobacterium sp. U410]